jgi:hypothetical protein
MGKFEQSKKYKIFVVVAESGGLGALEPWSLDDTSSGWDRWL